MFESISKLLANKKVLLYGPKGNAGDDLIEMGTKQFFEDNNVTYRNFRFWKQDHDYLVIRGGGYLGGMHHIDKTKDQIDAYMKGQPIPSSYDEHYHEVVIQFAHFQKLPIIWLPNSRTSDQWAPLNTDKDVYFVRETMTQAKVDNSILAPDMALYWNGYVTLPAIEKRELGVFLRSTNEVHGTYPGSVDPTLFLKTGKDYLEFASTYKTIVTNRLHFAIAALIVGTKVILVDNNYGKNKAMYDTWLHKYDCKFIPDINDLESLLWSLEVPHEKPI